MNDWLTLTIEGVCSALDNMKWKSILSFCLISKNMQLDKYRVKWLTRAKLQTSSVKCSQTSKWFDSSLLFFYFFCYFFCKWFLKTTYILFFLSVSIICFRYFIKYKPVIESFLELWKCDFVIVRGIAMRKGTIYLINWERIRISFARDFWLLDPVELKHCGHLILCKSN